MRYQFSYGVIMRSITLSLLFIIISVSAQAKNHRIWSTIPFNRGADLCAYKQAYSQTRMEYMEEMVGLASELMQSGAAGMEAMMMLESFDALYDKNRKLAIEGRYLDITLENTLKAYLDDFYRQNSVINRKVSFVYMNDIRNIFNAVVNNSRYVVIPDDADQLVDYVAYGTYTLAPNCQGNIQVTLTLIDFAGRTLNYVATGKPAVVMSQISARIIEDFQRTSLPTTIRLGNRELTILGTATGAVATATSLRQAEMICGAMGGRLPTAEELEFVSAIGDWNGGIGVGTQVWAISGNRVYHPLLMNPSPVRQTWEVNAKTYLYYCVQ